MFETCKYSQASSQAQFLHQLQNIFPGLWFASKCVSKCATTIYYCFRDHFPYYGGVVVSFSNAHEVMNHYIFSRSNIEATAVVSRRQAGADPGIFERGGPEAIIYKILERGGPKSLKMAFECSFQSCCHSSCNV